MVEGLFWRTVAFLERILADLYMEVSSEKPGHPTILTQNQPFKQALSRYSEPPIIFSVVIIIHDMTLSHLPRLQRLYILFYY